jgi:hypothetical protein
MDLTNASAIVTDDAGGFGSATVRRLAQMGAKVVIAGGPDWMISVIRRLVSDDGLSEVGHAGEHAAPWPAERERASPAFGVTRHRCADSRGSEGWSIYGAKRAQPVATGRKCDGPDNGSNKPIRNRWQPAAGKEGVRGSSPREGFRKFLLISSFRRLRRRQKRGAASTERPRRGEARVLQCAEPSS